MNHVFKSTEQALAFSFLMEILPAATKSPTGTLYDRMLREHGMEPAHSGAATINFTGLTDLEIRGQASMVRGAVLHQLSEMERFALWAQYGHQVTKARGVQGLRNYCLPMLTTQDQRATLALAWSLVRPRKHAQEFTMRAICKEYGLNPGTAAKDRRAIARTHQRFLVQATTRLQELFEAGAEPLVEPLAA
jgi:hypothetical protein